MINKDNYISVVEQRQVVVEINLDESLVTDADEGAIYVIAINGRKIRTMNFYTFARLLGHSPWKKEGK